MRLKDLATSVSDTFHLSREHVAIKDGFNVRFDKGTPDEWKQFVQSIRANGIIKAITGSKDASDKFIVTDGHRRIAGLDEAIALIEAEIAALSSPRSAEAKALKEEIARISVIPCNSESKGTTDADRLYSMGVGNTGKPFNLLENALLYERLMREHQQSDTEIQRRTGITRTAFDNAILLINAPEVHEFIRKGQITPSLALEICRKVKDKAQRIELIKEGIARAKAAGKDHATAKHLNPEVRKEVSPSTKGQRQGASGSTGAASTPSTAPSTNNSAGDSTRRSIPSLDSVLASRTSKLLSSVFDPKFKIDGAITLAMNRSNSTWFYSIEAEQVAARKQTLLSVPWTYGIFNGAAKVSPDAETRGFDDKDEAEHQAWRAIRHWITELTSSKSTVAALCALDARVAKLNGHGGGAGEGAGTANSSNGCPKPSTASTPSTPGDRGFTMHVSTGTHDAPPPPSDDDSRLSKDLGDHTPADADAAIEGFVRVMADVAAIAGATKKNERFVTATFLREYIDGQHTHNQLKGFLLYGSTETRNLKVSER